MAYRIRVTVKDGTTPSNVTDSHLTFDSTPTIWVLPTVLTDKFGDLVICQFAGSSVVEVKN